jgi:hypothetical protein
MVLSEFHNASVRTTETMLRGYGLVCPLPRMIHL